MTVELLGGDPLSLSVWGQYGIAGVIFVLAVFTIRWTDKHQRGWFNLAKGEVAEQKREIIELKEQNRLCEWRTEVLLGAMRAAGHPVPAAYWSAVPPSTEASGS